MKEFLKRKNIIFSAKRYGIDALGAMAQGLFASLLIGTIISTLGEQLGIPMLVTVGTYAKGATGAAMAVSIGYALQCPPLVLFSLVTVGMATNELGGAGGPLAVLIVTILAAEFFTPILPYCLSLAAGAMFYVVVEELIPEMSEGTHSNIGTIAFSVGFSLMMILDVALG